MREADLIMRVHHARFRDEMKFVQTETDCLV